MKNSGNDETLLFHKKVWLMEIFNIFRITVKIGALT